jgi:mannose-6-phosphate isomerase-like protein (cupin superfamily)
MQHGLLRKKTHMIDSPKLVDTPRRLVAAVRLTIPKDQIQNEMGPAIGEAMSVVAAQGLEVVGPWFCAHDRMDPHEWDFDVCVEVGTPVASQGRVKPGVLASVRAVQTNYRGPYEGLGEGWGAFESWIDANGFVGKPNLFERYCIGPESGGDASTFVTELNRPLMKVLPADFERALTKDGFSSSVVKFASGTINPEHVHAWDARLLVTEGEIAITVDGSELLYSVGDIFALPANYPHSEVVGSEGVSFIAGRRYLTDSAT